MPFGFQIVGPMRSMAIMTMITGAKVQATALSADSQSTSGATSVARSSFS